MKKTISNLLLTGAFLLLSTKVVAAADPKLYFSPATGSYHVNDTFAVTMMIDSGAMVAGAADLVGTFDPALLEITSIETATDMAFNKSVSGGSCSNNSTAEWATGKFSAVCYSSMTAGDQITTGNLMVITFKAKAVGTATVGYTCDGTSGDSNITQTSPIKDIIVCSANGSGSYTITAATGDAATPTPTTGSSTSTSTTVTPTTVPTQLPQTGGVATTVGLIVFGAISFASALFLKFL
ncbi:MAG: cohesin domain-containing protein [Candidatus Shapirobacteria bacterium]|nr:cohesin domain-containing protein [Candidatus Shapirobacteria bacterium]